MGIEDWGLDWSWPPAGDQWQSGVDPLFEPLELLGNKSCEAAHQLISDDVIQTTHFNSALSDGGSFLGNAIQQKNDFSTSYLMSAVGAQVSERQLSSWQELPSSPETFGVINDYQLYDEIMDKNTPKQQLSYLTDTVFSQTLVASSFSDMHDLESSDSATVPELELSTDDMLSDLDEAVCDVIMDPLKLVDFGPYLLPVSADDVESLLSSPSVVAASAPAAAPVDMDTGPTSATANGFPSYHEQIFVASPSGSEIAELSPVIDTGPAQVSANSLPVYREQVFVASPLGSEAELSSVATTCSPVYEERSPASSLVSSQYSTSAIPSDKKQRKKLQNKTAAQKYRRKKRGEQGTVMTEYEQLERKNIELRTRVEEMTREVDYLKGLIEEICA